MQIVWEMLSDQKIWSLLGDVERPLDEDTTRLMFIELFSRVKLLEEENLALRILLMEEGHIDGDTFNITKRAVKDFLKEKDNERASESDFFARSGVPFAEWVSFKLTGTFAPMDKEGKM